MLARTRAISTYFRDRYPNRSRLALLTSSSLLDIFKELDEVSILQYPTEETTDPWLIYCAIRDNYAYFGIQLPQQSTSEQQIASCFLLKELAINNCLFVAPAATLAPELFSDEWILANHLYNFETSNTLSHSPFFYPKHKFVSPDQLFSSFGNEGIEFYFQQQNIEIQKGTITQSSSIEIIQESFRYFPAKAWISNANAIFTCFTFFDIGLSCIFKSKLAKQYIESNHNPIKLETKEQHILFLYLTSENWK